MDNDSSVSVSGSGIRFITFGMVLMMFNFVVRPVSVTEILERFIVDLENVTGIEEVAGVCESASAYLISVIDDGDDDERKAAFKLMRRIVRLVPSEFVIPHVMRFLKACASITTDNEWFVRHSVIVLSEFALSRYMYMADMMSVEDVLLLISSAPNYLTSLLFFFVNIRPEYTVDEVQNIISHPAYSASTRWGRTLMLNLIPYMNLHQLSRALDSLEMSSNIFKDTLSALFLLEADQPHAMPEFEHDRAKAEWMLLALELNDQGAYKRNALRAFMRRGYALLENGHARLMELILATGEPLGG